MLVWPALLAFTGGVVAVALKGYADYLLERRKEGRTVQVAARLIFEELWSASAEIDSALLFDRLPRAEAFTWTAWDENKALIAASVEFENWRHIVFAYDAVRDALESSQRHAGLTAKAAEELDDSRHAIAAARGIVAELIKGYEWDPFPVHDDEHARQAKRYAWRRRRSRLGRKLWLRARLWWQGDDA